MTKEELEKEIRKYLKKTFHHEYYDDVVMVMGFAEPREKRIAELEKENAQWKQRNETLKDALEHARKVYGDELGKSYKEIAELKERLKNQKADYETYYKSCYNAQKKAEKQLTKAKDLLEELYDCIPSSSADYYKETLQKVADFLKDSEVEK